MCQPTAAINRALSDERRRFDAEVAGHATIRGHRWRRLRRSKRGGGIKGEPVEITLSDKRNFQLFQPLLYQAATAALSPGDIAWPIRSVFAKQKNVRVVVMDVEFSDVARLPARSSSPSHLRGKSRLKRDVTDA
jgi:hypothetical protein